MNKEVKEVILTALSQYRGDDLVRAQMAFRGYTAEQMQRQYGASGESRQEILDKYQRRADLVDEAVSWIKTQ